MSSGGPIPTPAEKPTLTIEEAGEFVGLGRSSAYEAARRGEIPVLRFGRTLRVPTARLRVMLGIDLDPVADKSAGTVVSIRQGTGT